MNLPFPFCLPARRTAALALLAATLLTGCASSGPQLSLFDLGPVRTLPAAPSPAVPAIGLADIEAPAWLDSQMMFYRLGYANQLQPRAYAHSKWTMPPAQLFAQRLKSSLTRSGSVVVAAADGAVNVPLLRLELEEFSQHFDSADSSAGEVAVRASLFDGRVLRAQKTFVHQVPAATADAQGGAAALAGASDAVIQDLRTWLAALPPKP